MNPLFTANYPERFRRAGSGLPSAVGVFRRMGFPKEAAVALLVPWAREHFDPPLADAEVERHVLSMYQGYGVPERSRRHEAATRLLRIEVQL